MVGWCFDCRFFFKQKDVSVCMYFFRNSYENWILHFDAGLSVADFLQPCMWVNVNDKDLKSGNIICSFKIFFRILKRHYA